MEIGYARVSMKDQTLQNQLDRLANAGCEKYFHEKISGAKKRSPALAALLEQIRADDIVVVTSLDRLARSTFELLCIAEALIEKNPGIQSIDDP